MEFGTTFSWWLTASTQGHTKNGGRNLGPVRHLKLAGMNVSEAFTVPKSAVKYSFLGSSEDIMGDSAICVFALT